MRPKLIADHERIVGIRDLFSVRTLIDKIQTARTIVVVGNGGIALELANEVSLSPSPSSHRWPVLCSLLFDECIVIAVLCAVDVPGCALDRPRTLHRCGLFR